MGGGAFFICSSILYCCVFVARTFAGTVATVSAGPRHCQALRDHHSPCRQNEVIKIGCSRRNTVGDENCSNEVIEQED
jgi:hypothetical protein